LITAIFKRAASEPANNNGCGLLPKQLETHSLKETVLIEKRLGRGTNYVVRTMV
jgi:hypothetical protein